MRLFGVIGAGGFGREVMPLARDWARCWAGGEPAELVFVVEDAFALAQQPVNGHRTLSMSQFLSAPATQRRYTIALADGAARRRIADSIPAHLAQPATIAASTHVALDGNEVGEGAIFCHQTVLTSNARIGRHFHCNIHSYVAHDCVIGDFVTFAPGVRCNGRVVIEDDAYIGTGVIIRDATHRPVVIGRGAVVGMGAVVTRSVPPHTTVVGNPARPL